MSNFSSNFSSKEVLNTYKVLRKYEKYYLKMIKANVGFDYSLAQEVYDDFIVFFLRYYLEYFDIKKGSLSNYIGVCMRKYLGRKEIKKKISKIVFVKDFDDCHYVEDKVNLSSEILINVVESSNIEQEKKDELIKFVKGEIKRNKKENIELLNELYYNSVYCIL